MCPDDSYGEAVADIICDGVNDFIVVVANIFREKDETKKVYLKALFEDVEPIFLRILMVRMFTVGDDIGGFRGFG